MHVHSHTCILSFSLSQKHTFLSVCSSFTTNSDVFVLTKMKMTFFPEVSRFFLFLPFSIYFSLSLSLFIHALKILSASDILSLVLIFPLSSSLILILSLSRTHPYSLVLLHALSLFLLSLSLHVSLSISHSHSSSVSIAISLSHPQSLLRPPRPEEILDPRIFQFSSVSTVPQSVAKNTFSFDGHDFNATCYF